MDDAALAPNPKRVLTGEEFRIWRKSRGLTLKELGEWLGVTLSAVSYYEKHGVSRIIGLALNAIDHGLPPCSITPEDIREAEEALKPANGDSHDGKGD